MSKVLMRYVYVDNVRTIDVQRSTQQVTDRGDKAVIAVLIVVAACALLAALSLIAVFFFDGRTDNIVADTESLASMQNDTRPWDAPLETTGWGAVHHLENVAIGYFITTAFLMLLLRVWYGAAGSRIADMQKVDADDVMIEGTSPAPKSRCDACIGYTIHSAASIALSFSWEILESVVVFTINMLSYAGLPLAFLAGMTPDSSGRLQFPSETASNVALSDGLQAVSGALFVVLSVHCVGIVPVGTLMWRRRWWHVLLRLGLWAAGSLMCWLMTYSKVIGGVTVQVGFYMSILAKVALYAVLWIDDVWTAQRQDVPRQQVHVAWLYLAGYVAAVYVAMWNLTSYSFLTSNLAAAVYLVLWTTVRWVWVHVRR